MTECNLLEGRLLGMKEPVVQRFCMNFTREAIGVERGPMKITSFSIQNSGRWWGWFVWLPGKDWNVWMYSLNCHWLWLARCCWFELLHRRTEVLPERDRSKRDSACTSLSIVESLFGMLWPVRRPKRTRLVRKHTPRDPIERDQTKANKQTPPPGGHVFPFQNLPKGPSKPLIVAQLTTV